MTTSIAKLEPATIKHAVVALISGMGRSKKARRPEDALTGQPRSERDQRYAIAAAAAIGGSELNYYDGYKFRLHQQRLLK
jgi:hypothetical protein